MKRIALVAAVFALAACSAKEQAPAADTAAPAMTPAPSTPAPDSAAMKAAADSAAMKMDSTHKMDSAAAAKKP